MPKLAILLIAFFVNVPLVAQGPVGLWDEAPALVVITAAIDVFLVVVVAFSIRRRLRELVQDSEA
ncbi:hypothetical protein [Nocardioides montaniterrae]